MNAHIFIVQLILGQYEVLDPSCEIPNVNLKEVSVLDFLISLNNLSMCIRMLLVRVLFPLVNIAIDFLLYATILFAYVVNIGMI